MQSSSPSKKGSNVRARSAQGYRTPARFGQEDEEPDTFSPLQSLLEGAGGDKAGMRQAGYIESRDDFSKERLMDDILHLKQDNYEQSRDSLHYRRKCRGLEGEINKLLLILKELLSHYRSHSCSPQPAFAYGHSFPAGGRGRSGLGSSGRDRSHHAHRERGGGPGGGIPSPPQALLVRVENEVARLLVHLSRLQDFDSQLDEKQQVIDVLKHDMAYTSVQELRAELQTYREEVQRLRQSNLTPDEVKAARRLRLEHQKTLEDLKFMKQEVESLRENDGRLRRELARTQSFHESKQQTYDELHAMYTRQREETKALEKKCGRLEELARKKDDKIAKVEGGRRKAKDDLDRLSTEHAILKDRLKDYELGREPAPLIPPKKHEEALQKVAKLEEENERLVGDTRKLRDELEKTEEKKNALEMDLIDAEGGKAKAEREKDETKRTLGERQVECRRLSIENERLQRGMEALRQGTETERTDEQEGADGRQETSPTGAPSLPLAEVVALIEPIRAVICDLDPAKADSLRKPDEDVPMDQLKALTGEMEAAVQGCKVRSDQMAEEKSKNEETVKELETKVSAGESLHSFLLSALALCDQLLDTAPLSREFPQLLEANLPELQTKYDKVKQENADLADLVPSRFFSTLERLQQHPVSGTATPRPETAAPPVGMPVPVEVEKKKRPSTAAMPGRLLRLVMADFKGFDAFLMRTLSCLHDASRELNILLPWDTKPPASDLPMLKGVVLLFRARVQAGRISSQTKLVPPLVFACTAADAASLSRLSEQPFSPAASRRIMSHGSAGSSTESQCIVDFDESLTLDIEEIRKQQRAKRRRQDEEEEEELTVQVAVDFFVLFLTDEPAAAGGALPPLLASTDGYLRFAAGGMPYQSTTRHFSIDEETLGEVGRLEWLCRWESDVDISEAADGYLDMKGRPQVSFLSDSEHMQTSAPSRRQSERHPAPSEASASLEELDRLGAHIRTAVRSELGGLSKMPSLRLCVSTIPPVAMPSFDEEESLVPIFPALLPLRQRKAIRLQVVDVPSFPDQMRLGGGPSSTPLRPIFVAEMPQGTAWTSSDSAHQGLQTGRHVSLKAAVEPTTAEGDEVSYVHHGEVSLSRAFAAGTSGPSYRFGDVAWLPYTPTDSYISLSFFSDGHSQPIALARLPVESLAMGGDEWQWTEGVEGEDEADEAMAAGAGEMHSAFLCPFGEVRYRLSLVGLTDVPQSVGAADAYAVYCGGFEGKFIFYPRVLSSLPAPLSAFVKCSVTIKLGNSEMTIPDGSFRAFLHDTNPRTSTADPAAATDAAAEADAPPPVPAVWIYWPVMDLTFPLTPSHFGGPLQLEIQVTGHFGVSEEKKAEPRKPGGLLVRTGTGDLQSSFKQMDTQSTFPFVLGKAVVPVFAGAKDRGRQRGRRSTVRRADEKVKEHVPALRELLKEKTGQWMALTDGIWTGTAEPGDDKRKKQSVEEPSAAFQPPAAACRCHNLSVIDVRSPLSQPPVSWEHLPPPLAGLLGQVQDGSMKVLGQAEKEEKEKGGGILRGLSFTGRGKPAAAKADPADQSPSPDLLATAASEPAIQRGKAESLPAPPVKSSSLTDILETEALPLVSAAPPSAVSGPVVRLAEVANLPLMVKGPMRLSISDESVVVSLTGHPFLSASDEEGRTINAALLPNKLPLPAEADTSTLTLDFFRSPAHTSVPPVMQASIDLPALTASRSTWVCLHAPDSTGELLSSPLAWQGDTEPAVRLMVMQEAADAGDDWPVVREGRLCGVWVVVWKIAGLGGEGEKVARLSVELPDETDGKREASRIIVSSEGLCSPPPVFAVPLVDDTDTSTLTIKVSLSSSAPFWFSFSPEEATQGSAAQTSATMEVTVPLQAHVERLETGGEAEINLDEEATGWNGSPAPVVSIAIRAVRRPEQFKDAPRFSVLSSS
ncbi:unnamed protein product [Vitrella brassicaformis CCMP3155]|uniref:Uncharacterized protein n=6 Tax=Vitrella brassicaformis TaxID=1169539 RepID=A0A0G4FJ19_VITBC|nr:unnamed protein product [Vitrella brassicaformis CCMP3155]|eukprot:CEM13769.1 unnamed protein product [Vitrella brassicaformis CCMP3155]